MAQQSPLFTKTEQFMVWLFEHTAKFPKHERFRLAKQIEEAIFAFHRYITIAAKTNAKIEYLQKADIELELLRSYMKLAMSLKWTTYGQYGYAAQQLSEIGKLLGAWLKKA